MSLGTTVHETNVDFDQGAFTFYGLRRLGAAADLTAGMRVNTLRGQLNFDGLGETVDQDQTWLDPVVGLTLRTNAERRLLLRVYSEIGGFGLGSDFTWQIFPTVGIRFSDTVSADLGYRWIKIDYATGEGRERFAYDVLTQGPLVGVSLRF